MSTGRLRERIEFQTVTVVDDGGGGSSETWATVLTVWGQYVPQRGREVLQSGQVESSNRGIVKVRSTTETQAINSNYTCVIDSVRFSIIAPPTNPDQRNKFLELTVEQGGAVT